MRDPNWLPKLRTWAQKVFPKQPILAESGDENGVWLLAQTVGDNLRERPLLLRPLPYGLSWIIAVKNAHRSRHPIVAIVNGRSRDVRLIKWTQGGSPDMGTPDSLAPDPQVMKAVQKTLAKPPAKRRVGRKKKEQ